MSKGSLSGNVYTHHYWTKKHINIQCNAPGTSSFEFPSFISRAEKHNSLCAGLRSNCHYILTVFDYKVQIGKTWLRTLMCKFSRKALLHVSPQSSQKRARSSCVPAKKKQKPAQLVSINMESALIAHVEPLHKEIDICSNPSTAI